MEPYVGVTGITSQSQMRSVIAACAETGFFQGTLAPRPMFGILVSYKRLKETFHDNKRYPYINNVPGLLEAGSLVCTAIHYNSREQGLDLQIADLFSKIDARGSARPYALQLNVSWPDVAEVRRIKESNPELRIILQVSDQPSQITSMYSIATRIRDYGNSIDAVLLDQSGGRARELDVRVACNLYQIITQEARNVIIGFAGGLCGENVREKVEQLRSFLGTKNFSIDAEGGLRDKRSEKYGDDLLNLEKVRSYLAEARKAFR